MWNRYSLARGVLSEKDGLSLLEAGGDGFGKGAGGVVVEGPDVGAAELLCLDVGRLDCHGDGVVVGVEGSLERVVERCTDTGGIVPGGKAAGAPSFSMVA